MRMLCIFLVLVNATYFLWQARAQSQKSLANLSDAATPSLMLLNELPNHAVPILFNNTKVDQMDAVASIKAPPEMQRCIVLGGFVDQASAEKAAGVLSQHGVAGKLGMIETQTIGSYLVYLPPFESHADALVKFHELKAKGIDSFIIADGDRINGISLGVFAKEESAKKLQIQLNDNGYKSSIVGSVHTTQQYTLRIANQSEEMLTESLRSELAQKYAGGRLTQAESSCIE